MRIISEFSQLVKERRFIQFCEHYSYCIEKRRSYFDSMKRRIEAELEHLEKEGKISEKTKFLSRIKSPASAAEKILNKRGTYDIFGVTILVDTDEELAIVQDMLDKIDRKDMYVRDYTRPGGRNYRAINYLLFSGAGDDKIVIECHLQTQRAYDECYPHAFYKYTKKLAGKKFDVNTAEEQIIKEAQEQYRSGEISGHTLSNGRGSAIPEMWEAGFNSNGKMIERKLDEKETIRIVYYPCFEEFDMDLGYIR